QAATGLTGGSSPAGGNNGTIWVNDHNVVANFAVVSDSELIPVFDSLFMKDIPGGTFTMGDNLDGEADAAPTTVTVSEFYMDPIPVLYADWRTFATYGAAHGYLDLAAGAGKK